MPMGPQASAQALSTVREQLAGACTTEIASFDEFASLLAEASQAWDHIVFDTAPTGHTLRLLSLPKAWTGFLDGNDRGASCLGPHSGLKLQEARCVHSTSSACRRCWTRGPTTWPPPATGHAMLLAHAPDPAATAPA